MLIIVSLVMTYIEGVLPPSPFVLFMSIASAFVCYIIFAFGLLELPWRWVLAMVVLASLGLLTLQWKPVQPKSKVEATQPLEELQPLPPEKSPVFIEPSAIKDGSGKRLPEKLILK